MTACSSTLQALLYVDESTWAENSTDMTGAVRISHREPITLDGFEQAMLEPMRVTQYINEQTLGIPGPMACSFSFSVWLAGHGSTTSGATSMTPLGNLLKWVLGAGNVSASSGTTISGAGSTTTTFTTAASGTFDPGSMFRLGAIGDGDGEGQWYVVDSHTLTNLVSEVAAPGAPANGAVVYSAETIGTVETDCAISTGKRFLIQTADNQYVVHGCYPSAISFSGTNPGEMLVATITVTGSWFEPVSATFPSAVAASMTSTPSPNAQGSVNFQTYATTTRNALSIRQCAITVNLGTQAVYGLDTVGQYQRICGAKRTPTTVTVSLTVDAAGASTTPTYWTDFLTNGAKHLLISFATAAGQAAGMYLAWCRYSGKRPTQASVDNLNRVQFQVTAGTDTAESTDDLSLSALRIGLA